MSHCSRHKKSLSRRDFLRAAGLAAAGTVIAGCQTPEPTPQPTPELTAEPTPEPTPEPTATKPVSSRTSRPKVAIASARNYDRKAIYGQVRDLLDGIGGLGDVVSSGDRVAIKTNLTGGTSAKPLPGIVAIDSYITHPEVVRALGELLRDAGAREILIVEAVYEWASYTEWGYEEIAEDIEATLIDLNDTVPYSDFAQTPVGENAYFYTDFTFNHILEEVDAFVSVSKLKNHWWAGVTHTMKNLFGLVPARFYRLSEKDNYRSAFHGEGEEATTRIPRVIMDLNRARPIHLGLVDGIKTAQSGEGPWIESMSALEPGILIAGKDVVATDAVATATMGYDPTAQRPTPPFIRGDNHLNLAYELGLGTNRLEEIEVVGLAIDDVKTKFEPCWE
jgi:uncharacterized protein (DUF362 family)